MSDDAIVVSVVVPMFNSEPWIAETLASVLRQDFPKDALEIIVVDDGSTDRCAEVARSVLATGGVRHQILSTPNGGPSRARNLGWQQARGEWIQFLDADDLLAPDKLRTQTRAASAEAAVVFSCWQRFRTAASEPDDARLRLAVLADPIADLLRSDNFIATGSQLIRQRWLAAVGGFDERLRLIEDVHLLLRIAMAGGIFQSVTADHALFFYRQRVGESLSHSDPRAFTEACVRNAELVEEHSRAQRQLTASRIRLISEVYVQASQFFAAHDRARFEEVVARLLALDPAAAPSGTMPLRLLARVVGFRRAELFASRYRALRAWVRRSG